MDSIPGSLVELSELWPQSSLAEQYVWVRLIALAILEQSTVADVKSLTNA